MANNKVTIVKNYTKTVACGQMGGLMGVIAVVLSSSMNHSFWWGVLHFLLGGFYVMYALLCRSHEIVPALKAMFQ